MTTLWKCLPALLTVTAMFAASANDAMALCNPGTKNCVSVPAGRPKFCSPCTIDGGLGSTCKSDGGGGQCGLSTGTTGTTTQPGGLDGSYSQTRSSAPHATHMHAEFTRSTHFRR